MTKGHSKGAIQTADFLVEVPETGFLLLARIKGVLAFTSVARRFFFLFVTE